MPTTNKKPSKATRSQEIQSIIDEFARVNSQISDLTREREELRNRLIESIGEGKEAESKKYRCVITPSSQRKVWDGDFLRENLSADLLEKAQKTVTVPPSVRIYDR